MALWVRPNSFQVNVAFPGDCRSGETATVLQGLSTCKISLPLTVSSGLLFKANNPWKQQGRDGRSPRQNDTAFEVLTKFQSFFFNNIVAVISEELVIRILLQYNKRNWMLKGIISLFHRVYLGLPLLFMTEVFSRCFPFICHWSLLDRLQRC